MVDALEDYGVEWLVTCRTFWPLLTSTLRFVRDARSLKITTVLSLYPQHAIQERSQRVP